MNCNPFVIKPDCLNDRSILKAVLTDIFLSEKLKVNLTLAAYDEGIVEELNETDSIDNFFLGKFIRILMSDYGISEESAIWSVEYWVNNYGVEVLGKENNIIFELAPSVEPPKPIFENTKDNIVIPAPADMVQPSKYEDNEKLPKSLIQRFPNEEKKNGITDLRCSIFKEYSSDRHSTLKVIGEYSGKCSKYTLKVIMIYNANDELIDADFNESIDENFSGKKTFTHYMQVPNDEYISKVVIRFLPDPVFVD